MQCPVCDHAAQSHHASVDGIDFFECKGCGSLFADPDFLADVQAGRIEHYQSDYWQQELSAARERSYGSSLNRVAELFFYARIEIRTFLDVGTGPGFLLDAISTLLPEWSDDFHGVELFPPAQHSRHKNYRHGQIADLPGTFDAGCCIEVIEHLTPATLCRLIRQLADKTRAGSLFYFGSGQPAYVKNEDPAYLDPLVRGHIVSYSIKGLRPLFAEHGFNVIPLPGRDWAFLAERAPQETFDADQLLTRLWNPHPANQARLQGPGYAPMMRTMGLESARCYLEAAIAVQRTQWALSLQAAQLKHSLRGALTRLGTVGSDTRGDVANIDDQGRHPGGAGVEWS